MRTNVQSGHSEQNSHLELLAHVAELYYLRGLNQAEIAGELGLSRIKVVRLLKEAREKGIVRISIVRPEHTFSSLERRLENQFGLKRAIVVPNWNEAPSSEQVNKAIARAAATYLDDVLKDGDIVGVGWGTTVYEVVQSAFTKRGEVAITCIPLIGGLGELHSHFQINDLARRLAEVYRGHWRALHAPFLVEKEEIRDAILSDRIIHEIASAWEKVTIALVGIGASISHSPMLRTGYFGTKDILQMEQLGSVGDICSRFFDRDGRPCQLDINGRMIGITLDTLKKLDHVVAVAGGLYKIDAIRAALSGGYVNVLVTDELTAGGILGTAGG